MRHSAPTYFRLEGDGLICGTHHRLLQPDDYQRAGGVRSSRLVPNG